MKNILNMLKKKKGVELSMQTIVVVIVLLITIAIVIMIFSGQMGTSMNVTETISTGNDCNTFKTSSSTSTCKAKASCAPTDKQQFGNFKQNKEGLVCCCPTS